MKLLRSRPSVPGAGASDRAGTVGGRSPADRERRLRREALDARSRRSSIGRAGSCEIATRTAVSRSPCAQRHEAGARTLLHQRPEQLLGVAAAAVDDPRAARLEVARAGSRAGRTRRVAHDASASARPSVARDVQRLDLDREPSAPSSRTAGGVGVDQLGGGAGDGGRRTRPVPALGDGADDGVLRVQLAARGALGCERGRQLLLETQRVGREHRALDREHDRRRLAPHQVDLALAERPDSRPASDSAPMTASRNRSGTTSS